MSIQGMFTGYFGAQPHCADHARCGIHAMFLSGPIGIGALYYALMATDRLPDDFSARNNIIAATTFIIFCSIIVHGTSAPLIMRACFVLLVITVSEAWRSKVISKIPGRYGGRQPGEGVGTDADGPGERDALLGDGIPQGSEHTAGQRTIASRHERRAYR
jgi:hypothetical protein